MSATNYLELGLLDHLLGGPDYTRPANVYFALFTAAPAESGGGTEASGGGYARVAVANNNTNFAAASSPGGVGTKLNATMIAFPQASGSWGTVTHFGIFDASSGGNLLISGALTTSRAVVSGDTPRFLANAFSLTAD